jgi:hypothetical protein
MYVSGASHVLGASYVSGTSYVSAASYVLWASYVSGASYVLGASIQPLFLRFSIRLLERCGIICFSFVYYLEWWKLYLFYTS